MEEGMHRFTEDTEGVARAIVDYALDRIRLDPPPIDGPLTEAELAAKVGDTVTPRGIGAEEALRLFGDVLAPACISVDNPRFLAFVPAAPTWMCEAVEPFGRLKTRRVTAISSLVATSAFASFSP